MPCANKRKLDQKLKVAHNLIQQNSLAVLFPTPYPFLAAVKRISRKWEDGLLPTVENKKIWIMMNDNDKISKKMKQEGSSIHLICEPNLNLRYKEIQFDWHKFKTIIKTSVQYIKSQ